MAKRTKADAETEQIVSDAEHIQSLTRSNGWVIVHAKLVERVVDMQNINNIDVTNPDSIGSQIAARKMAAELVMEWLKQDVFGAIEASEINVPRPDMRNEGYIDRG
jgi:hypothetical protein